MSSPSSATAAPHEPFRHTLPPMTPSSRSNPIDLTLDDDDRDPYQPQDRLLKRQCNSSRSFNASCENILDERARSGPQSSGLTPVMSASAILPPIVQPNIPQISNPWQHCSPFRGPQPPMPSSIRPPPFTGPSSSTAFFPDRVKSEATHRPLLVAPSPSHHGLENHANGSSRQVIDLTSSPSPPLFSSHLPPPQQGNLPPDLPPKTPVCIGQLAVTALVLYPIPYLLPQEHGDPDWAPVRLTYEHTPHKAAGSETIHIKTPSSKSASGEVTQGENFAFVEQKAATYLGPMLGKGLIRLDAKIRRGVPNLPILPLQLLVYTPKGNIPVVGGYLQQYGLLLDHPTLPGDIQRVMSQFYYNPHNPPPGGHNRNNQAGRLGYSGPAGSSMGRWAGPGVPGKSVEIQRSQVDELFKSLRDGEELQETEPPPEVATKLYPHQKKALTFLLERERERPGSGPSGKHSSLWQERVNPITGQHSWAHLITQREMSHEPQEAKSSILADDMGLGKTITCVSLIAATMSSAHQYAATPISHPGVPPPEPSEPPLTADHFTGSVWGMPTQHGNSSCSKGKAKSNREQDREQAGYARACRIKIRSRATLIVCPLSTVVNWEDQFREHWRGEVNVVGGGGSAPLGGSSASGASTPLPSTLPNGSGMFTFSSSSTPIPVKSEPQTPGRLREGAPLRVYVYHGNARRPDPTFLADFDAVITTYSTLASEFSKQSKSIASADDDEDEDDNSSDGERLEADERGNQFGKLSKPKRAGKKRKKCGVNGAEATSPLQSVDWFRVVLDEAHSIKETSTVACRASCDLVADRRLCLTGTPVQNKLDDVFALIKFLRLAPLDDKAIWTEFIGTPVKYGQPLGVARLQTIMKCITLRRTKESKAEDGRRILSLPPRKDELRYLKFSQDEQAIYDQFFTESKAEFNELSNKNEVMKNYVGILQKILRLRQICDHFELVQDKGLGLIGDAQGMSYDDVVATVTREGLNPQRAATIFALLKEAGVTQCVECGCELAGSQENIDGSLGETEGTPGSGKRGRKPKAATPSRASTRQNSPTAPHPILTRCQHLFCVLCFRNSVAPGWPNVPQDVGRCCSVCQTGLGSCDAVEVNPDLTAPDGGKKRAIKKEKRQKGVPPNFNPSVTSTKVQALLSDLMDLSRANPYSMNYDPSSLEFEIVDGDGKALENGGVKTVVFSQWTTMLDKVEDALEWAGIRYSRLDGTMKRDERTRAMDSLKHDPACEVLLVSLKAGGVGLNLTAAQRVYLMDPYWNPAVENQAVDRIHRLGQTRPVLTVKYIIENSIEDRLLEVQRKKTELANLTLGGGNFSKAEMLQRRLEELNQLFGA